MENSTIIIVIVVVILLIILITVVFMGNREEEIKKVNKENDVKKNRESRVCCASLSANCMSCAMGLTVEEYCEKFPERSGCK